MKQHHRPKSQHTHHHFHRPEERKSLLWCILITAGMMVVEFIAGFWTGSLSLLSDAGHMLSHFFALTVSYGAIWFASRPETHRKTYGYYRVEILSALLNGVSLVVITGFIVYVAVMRFYSPVPIMGREMFFVALAGLLVNVATALILHKHSVHDMNIRGAFLHMLGDTVSSVGVVIAAIVIHFTGELWIDLLVSVAIAALILIWSVKLILDSVHVLMESTPKHIQLEEVARVLKEEVAGINDIHDLHVWEITSKMYSLTAHIIVNDCSLSSTSAFLEKCNTVLNERFDIQHTTIQIECEALSS